MAFLCLACGCSQLLLQLLSLAFALRNNFQLCRFVHGQSASRSCGIRHFNGSTFDWGRQFLCQLLLPFCQADLGWADRWLPFASCVFLRQFFLIFRFGGWYLGPGQVGWVEGRLASSGQVIYFWGFSFAGKVISWAGNDQNRSTLSSHWSILWCACSWVLRQIIHSLIDDMIIDFLSKRINYLLKPSGECAKLSLSDLRGNISNWYL